VIELLGENKMKILKDLESEEKEMAAFSQNCDDESSARTYAIETATQTIATLEATLEDTAAQIEGLSDDIAALGSEIAAKDADLAKATGIRKTEKADFDKDEAELVKSVDQLERAVVMIKRGTAPAFVQSDKHSKVDPKKAMDAAMKVFAEILDANRVDAGMRRKLENFVQTTNGNGEDEYQKLSQPQPTVKTYESSSGGIIGELEAMKEKAEETLSDTRMAEMRKQHNFDTFAQSLTDGLKIASDKLADAKKSKAASIEAAGKAKGELVEAKESKAADEKFLSQLTASCKETAASWEERQESAHAEMAAINKATEILTEGVRVFMQVGHKSKKGDGDLDADEKSFDDEAPAPVDQKRMKVVEKLKQLSSKYGSYALMELAGTAASDPFVKVKGLIEEMIAKLVTEANEEATQEAFCQEEMSKSNAAKDEKTMTSDSLSSRIAKAASTKALLEQKVKELESEIAALDSGMAEATKLRTAEKATNEKSASDFKLAADSVEKAIKVLKEYYETAALIQVKKSEQPEFGGAKSDASHAIISILEMSGEDFTKMHMETETAEADAVSTYEQLALDTKVSKAAKSAEVKGSLSEIKSLDVALKNHKEDLDMTNKELSAVMEYLEKLKPQCESKVMSYAEKKSRREAEISGLKEALTILEGDAVLMQKSVHKHFLN